jgi:dihydrofolate reductase
MTNRTEFESELISYTRLFAHVSAIANVRYGDWAIGSQNQLLPECKSKQDWDRFVQASYKHDVLLMGSKTADSISKVWRDTGTVLPGRNVAVASGGRLLNVPENFELHKSSLLVCGGRQIYKLLLPYCRSVMLTITNPYALGKQYSEADSYFPTALLSQHFNFWLSDHVASGISFDTYLHKQ